MSVNKIILLGNLGKDAETRQVGDKTVISFRLATTDKYTDRNGQSVESTEWHSCEYWSSSANVVQYLKKGVSVFVEGSLRTDTYQGQDGQQRELKKVRVQSLQLVGSKPQAQAQPQAPQYPSAPVPPPMPGAQAYPPQTQGYPQQPQGYPQPIQGYPQYPPQAPQYPSAPAMPAPPEDMPPF